jgi:hypothetical protein
MSHQETAKRVVSLWGLSSGIRKIPAVDVLESNIAGAIASTCSHAIAAKDAEMAKIREALRELHAMVLGECPALLNEDSGGNGELDLSIRAALEGGEA